MASDEGNAWFLHGQGGRRFGPLNEDEIRGYFRAGMVKSVDRITAPGFAEPLPAGAVAAMLGETAPAGPPPPPLVAEAPAAAAPVANGIPAANLSPGAAPARPSDAELEERARRAMAAMNIDLVAMSASSPARKSSGWLLPAIAGLGLIVMLMFALNMLRNLSQGGSRAAPTGGPQPAASQNGDAGAGPAVPPPALGQREFSDPRPAQAPTAETSVDAEASFRRADQLMLNKDWAGLLAHATAWTQAQPERNDSWQFLGLAHARLGNTDKAVEALKHVLASEPGNNNARVLLAEIYLGAHRWPEAAEAYKQLVAAIPQDARLWNNYGVALGQVNQGPQAAAALETAVKLDPTFKQAWTNLGQTYQNMGDGGRASAAFAQANALR